MSDTVKIDRFAHELFKDLGFDSETDSHLCETYITFKKYKDMIQPGKLTAEGYAFVAAMADFTRGVDDVEEAEKLARRARNQRSKKRKKEAEKVEVQKPKPMSPPEKEEKKVVDVAPSDADPAPDSAKLDSTEPNPFE